MLGFKMVILSLELADRVSNITFTEITKSSANISWTFVGDTFDYTIDCNDCSKPNIFPVDSN